MKMPIYRAKKIDSDEYVIFNSFYEYENKYYAINKIINQTIDGWFTNVMIPLTYKIDPTTLAIHFPDILDSQGNKIFASLDIKGGSLIEYEEKIFEAMYLNGLIQGVANMDSIQNSLFKYSKIIGIQE